MAMCFPCTFCGLCGKYDNPDLPTEKDAVLRCFVCGAPLVTGTQTCPACGKTVWRPPGTGVK